MHARTGLMVGEVSVLEGLRARRNTLRFVKEIERLPEHNRHVLAVEAGKNVVFVRGVRTELPAETQVQGQTFSGSPVILEVHRVFVLAHVVLALGSTDLVDGVSEIGRRR